MSDEKKEHPIIFTGPMVQAILEGKKTMTRRVMKPQIKCDHSIYQEASWKNEPTIWNIKDGQAYCQLCGNGVSVGNGRGIKSRYGKVGDLLWVRETWQTSYVNNKWIPIFKADAYYIDEDGPTKWKPSIHMLKKHARIWLEVTNIKVERLQSISEEDILSEGVRYHVSQDNHVLFQIGGENRAWDFMPEQWKLDQHVENRGKEKHVTTEKEIMFAHWAELWCEINGKESWEANPWVWAISFKKTSNG